MELYWLTAQEIQEKILNREIKVEEVVQIVLERIRQVEDKINAFVTVCENEALQQARKIDKKIVEKEKLGRLVGIPIAIKDNISTKGIKTTCGSKILENYVPPYNATVVEKILAEDAIIIGKTNMDEFAMGTTTETSYFGPTKNPWDLSRVPGGSSGGSAAALAAGETFLALGSDTGGSIRCPASFCGIVGLKPTYGLVSRYGLIAYANTFEQIGPMARTTYDCALLLNVIAGWDPKDSTSVQIQTSDYVEKLTGDFKKLKIGIPKEMIGEGTEDKVLKSLFNYVSKLEEFNVEWTEISLPTLDYALPAYYLIAMSEASSNLARFDGVRYGYRVQDLDLDWNQVFSKSRREGFGAEVKRRIILGTYALSAGYYDKFFLKSLKAITLIKEDFEKAFKKFDVLVSPTMPILPFKLGEKINNPLALYLCDVDTVPVNLVGIPAITFPCDFQENLPVGVQVMAPPFKEDLLLKISYLSERKLQFNKFKPKCDKK
ncbi:Asp-tRNA(Asn)/Glu-tRNA(Gln) amidotransferase GatCAB subunit A [Candidatus Bathyarchaeota archaeon]|nr:MAG: Asp-tRNA(Asn)/Glu-tRNA(Gln) amidotransferase GatCAB subunit A [Candidatus Bathyarchaeota archaeon]